MSPDCPLFDITDYTCIIIVKQAKTAALPTALLENTIQKIYYVSSKCA
jgi:hypothetical protein